MLRSAALVRARSVRDGIVLHGDLELGSVTLATALAAVEVSVPRPSRRLTIDFRNLTYIDLAGLRILLSACAGRARYLILRNAPRSVAVLVPALVPILPELSILGVVATAGTDGRHDYLVEIPDAA